MFRFHTPADLAQTAMLAPWAMAADSQSVLVEASPALDGLWAGGVKRLHNRPPPLSAPAQQAATLPATQGLEPRPSECAPAIRPRFEPRG